MPVTVRSVVDESKERDGAEDDDRPVEAGGGWVGCRGEAEHDDA